VQADALEFLPTLDASSVQLTVFSPPYDGIRDYHSTWDPAVLLALGPELLRVTEEGGVCCVVLQDGTQDYAKTLTSFRTVTAWADCGWRLFECCIYQRQGRPGAWWNTRFRVDHEYIFMFLKGAKPRAFDKEPLKVPNPSAGKRHAGTDRRTDGRLIYPKHGRNAALKCRGTVWKYNTSTTEGNVVKARHPATMPDALARDLILCFSAPGDLVLDPMCGSGTTCVMAQELGRQWLGVEVAEEYVRVAQERVGGGGAQQ
jgi:site-specific DNA-methyltransferase (adenine-specific)